MSESPDINPQPLPPIDRPEVAATEYPAYPLPGAAPGTYGVAPPTQDEYDAVPPLSQGQRVMDTFFAPSKTFADIRRNRSWWLPFLLLVVFSLAFSALAVKRVGVDSLAENAIRANPAQAEKIQNAPPEARAQAMKFTAISMEVGLYGAPVFLLLWSAFLALLLWVGFNFILGGSSTYPGMFAVSMYALLPSLVAYVLLIVMLFVGDTETFNLANATGTNIGYYLPQGASPLLKSLLTSIDLFTLWQCFLLGIGGAIVARLKPTKGLTLVFGVWIVIVLIKAGIAAATS